MPTNRDEYEARRRAALQAALERAIAADLQRAIEEAAQAAAERVRAEQHKEEVAEAVAALLLGGSLYRLLRGRLLAVALAFVQFTHAELGVTSAELDAQASHAAQQWVTQYAASVVNDIAQSTAARVLKTLTTSETDKLAAEETAKRILALLAGDAGEARARGLAGDLAHAVSGYASDEAARYSRLQVLRMWTSMEDIKVRPSHRLADGQIVGLDQPFIVGGYNLRFPGDPLGPPREVINCRCVTLYRRISQVST